MCGRARSSYTAKQVLAIANVNSNTFECRANENAAPGHDCSVIVQDEATHTRSVTTMTWGLIPHFFPKVEKPDHYFAFNCRVETITEKKSFKMLVAKGKRCVVILEGFYEWALEAGEKQPYYIFKQDESPMLFAALYDEYYDLNGCKLVTFAILTQPSGTKMKYLHHRQPIYLLDNQVDTWLDPAADVSEMIANWNKSENYENLCSQFKMHPVTPKMNSLTYRGEDCSLPVSKSANICKFFKSTKSPMKSPIKKELEAIAKSTNTNDNVPSAETKPSDPSEPVVSLDFHDNDAISEVSVSSGAANSSSTANAENEEQVSFSQKSTQSLSSQKSSVTTDGDAGESIFCPLCQRNITKLSVDARNSHAASCSGESRSDTKSFPEKKSIQHSFNSSSSNSGSTKPVSKEKRKIAPASSSASTSSTTSTGTPAKKKPTGASFSASPKPSKSSKTSGPSIQNYFSKIE